MTAPHRVTGVFRYLWALPWTLVGLAIGFFGVATGGRVARRGAVLEFHGGFVTWMMNRLRKMAMTWGYSIIGTDPASLDAARRHEMVHVRQYGQWGFFFVPVYVLSSLVQWYKGNNMYRDNLFEVEAYAEAPIVRSKADQSGSA